jgi:hypothetical protein
VTLATATFNRALRIPRMEARDTATLVAEYSSLPNDFLELVAVRDSDGVPLRYVGRQEFDLAKSGASSTNRIMTVEEGELRVWPAPTVSEPLAVTLLYYEELGALSDDADTNWLLTDYPDAYIYGALVHARVWLHDSARVVEAQAMYERALAELRRLKWVATGAVSTLVTDVPTADERFDITRG